jgi:serine/threonine protein kinase
VRPQLFACGTVLDKYRIEALLGAGGAAEVYRAKHLLLRVPVALKVVRSRDPWVLRQILEEARCLARIDHANVVRVLDLHHGDEATYIVMQYVEGRSLAKTIEARGPMAPAVVTTIAIDVALGLRAALVEGVIHRDVKPGNILVPTSAPARVVDFGLAYVHGRDEQFDGVEGPERVGTEGYMAPELAASFRHVDFRADVYSLGVTIAQALLGHASPPAHPADVARSAPPVLADLVAEMTAEAPEQRPKSYEEVVARLRFVLATISALA